MKKIFDLWFVIFPALFLFLWILLIVIYSTDHVLAALYYVGMLLRLWGFVLLLYAINDQLKFTGHRDFLDLLKKVWRNEIKVSAAVENSPQKIKANVKNIDSQLEPIISADDSKIDIIYKKIKSLRTDIKNSKKDVLRILKDSEDIIDIKINKLVKEVENHEEKLNKITQKNFRREIFGVLIIIDGFLFMNLTEELKWLIALF